MKFGQRRAVKKLVQHVLHDAKHARHMRADVADRHDVEALIAAEQNLVQTWKDPGAGISDIESAADAVHERARTIYPQKAHPRIRENVEILVVALAVAMGFRTYFVQPFKIPTGSMQPTLFGITVTEQRGRGMFDIFPLSLVPLCIFGERYITVKAEATGQIFPLRVDEFEWYEIRSVDGIVRQKMPPRLSKTFRPGDYVSKGQALAEGRVRRGDHIFVDKVRYNFSRPKRGDIFVFSTDDIQYPLVRKHAFYIKRLVGLPGEKIAVDPPYLKVNDRRVEEPFAFKRLVTDTNYSGYVLAANLNRPAKIETRRDAIVLGEDEYLPFGDNTRHSLDGRYFGAVKRKDIVGPAFMIYWPFGYRWGRVI